MVESPLSAEFTVTPTTISDEYEIVVETTFETTVPAPALTAIPVVQTFHLRPGETTTGEVTLFNMGLVSAFDVQLAPRDSTYVKLTYAVPRIAELPAKGAVTVPFTVHLKSHGSPPPPSCKKQCATTDLRWLWECITAGTFVPQSTTLSICVDVPPCKIETNQSTITRVTYVNCGEQLTETSGDDLCVRNASGDKVKLCECGILTARGIGLPSVQSIIDEVIGKITGKLEDLADRLTGDVLETLLPDDYADIAEAQEKLNSAQDLLDQASGLLDEVLNGQCADEGIAENLRHLTKQAAQQLAAEAVNKVLTRFTGGIISFSSKEFGFEKSCLSPGEDTCAKTADPEFSFGFGSMSFCVSCCGPEPEEGRGEEDDGCCPEGGEGADCPVNIPFVDATVICGLGGGSTQSIGGGGPSGGSGGFGGFGGGGPGSGSGSGGTTSGGRCDP